MLRFYRIYGWFFENVDISADFLETVLDFLCGKFEPTNRMYVVDDGKIQGVLL